MTQAHSLDSGGKVSGLATKGHTGQRNISEFGQIVLVLQGGGALGAYQAGVYQALHEAGVEPDWVIGTSIGAINASLIAGNKQEHRLAKLEAFWNRVVHTGARDRRECSRCRPHLVELDNSDDWNTGFLQTKSPGISRTACCVAS
jgi:predicted acylesterase/phospholipase RssA